MKKQNLKWALNGVLYIGFLLLFYLDLTGLPVHQWLGVGVGACCLLHLLQHGAWVKTTLSKFAQMPGRTQINFMVDTAIALGIGAILISGLIMSTWFNLPLNNYATWSVLHTAFAVETLIALLVKLVLHWKMIGLQIRRLFSIRQPSPKAIPARPLPQVLATASTSSGKTVSRRDFLALLGAFTLVSTLAITHVAKGDVESTTQANTTDVSDQTAAAADPTATSAPTEQATAQIAEAQPTATAVQPTATTQPTVVQAVNNTSCTVRCRNGCSFPGRCRRYTDSNGNNKCDLGECL